MCVSVYVRLKSTSTTTTKPKPSNKFETKQPQKPQPHCVGQNRTKMYSQNEMPNTYAYIRQPEQHKCRNLLAKYFRSV